MTPGALPNRTAPQTHGQELPRDPETDASALWVKFTGLPRPLSDPEVFRAKGQEVGTLVFRVLTSVELTSVFVSAHKATEAVLGSDAKGSIAYEEIYVEEKGIALAQLACRQPDSPTFPVFMNARDVRENLTDDEIGYLLAKYAIFRRESGPMLNELSPEEMEAWIQLLAKGASRSPLGRCTGEVLQDLLMYAVSKLREVSLTATSSAGALPEGSSTRSQTQDQPDGAGAAEFAPQ